MPTRALHPCADPTCNVLLRQGGRCAKHARPRWSGRHHTSRHLRGYGTPWMRVRAQVLAEEPTCRACQAAPSVTVDHIKAKAKGGGEERANLRGLCAACRRVKDAQDGNASMRSNAR